MQADAEHGLFTVDTSFQLDQYFDDDVETARGRGVCRKCGEICFG